MTRHLLIIGAQRSGTSYLRTLLEAHPEIAMARPVRPEPKVFLSAESNSLGLAWYRERYFSHATNERVLGEKSTSYLECPEAAGRAATVLGTADILVLLRDPVARAISNWRFSSENGFEDRDCAEALTRNLAQARSWDPAATSVSPYAYLERGRYVDYLAPWLEHFPDRVHVRFFEELVSSPAVLSGIYAALGVDPDFRPAGLGEPVNGSTWRPAELAPASERQLRDYFHESDARLAALLERPLPWTANAR